MKKRLVGAGVAIVVGALSSGAGASIATQEYNTSYDVNITAGQPVTNILLLEDGSTTWAFQADGSGTPGVDQETVITNPFTTVTLPTSVLMIGITQDLTGDAPGQKHVVLMMDDAAANLAENIAWGTLFRNTDEDVLISNIELATSGQDWPIITPGLDAVGTFASGDATDGILDGLAQPHSAWFSFGSTFTVMTWSDGQIIGTGTSTAVPTPEPASLLGLALTGAGLLLRRRTVSGR